MSPFICMLHPEMRVSTCDTHNKAWELVGEGVVDCLGCYHTLESDVFAAEGFSLLCLWKKGFDSLVPLLYTEFDATEKYSRPEVSVGCLHLLGVLSHILPDLQIKSWGGDIRQPTNVRCSGQAQMYGSLLEGLLGGSHWIHVFL